MSKKCGIKIKVTWKHIEQGIPGDSSSCAIALACREAFGRRVPISVDGSVEIGEMYFEGDKKVNNFVAAFDDAQHFDREEAKVSKEYREEHSDYVNGYKKAKPFTLYLTNGKAIAG